MFSSERRAIRLTTAAASAGALSAALFLGGCDSDGAGVADAGSNGSDDHVDTALSSSLEQAAPQPTPGNSADSAGSSTAHGAQPTPAPENAGQSSTSVTFGTYRVPLGEATLLCDFAADPAAEGYAWACESPAHLGWRATKGGEANSVAYRPGATPEVYAVLGNSGLTAEGTLTAGAATSIGGRYTVDAASSGAVTITDTTTGVSVRLTDGGYARL